METFFKKVVSIALVIMLAMLIIPTKIYAADESVAIVKIDEDYIIYINNMEDKEFKFAFTNDGTLTESTAANNLNFVANWEDSSEAGSNNIACLEKSLGLDESQPIYMWIEKEDGTYSSTELNLEEALTMEDIENLEKLTEIIKVDTKSSKQTATNENGVAMTLTVGEIDITDSSDCDYRYQMIKIDGTEPETAKNLISLVDSLQNDDSSMSMYDQIVMLSKINGYFKTLLTNATWTDVENMVIS